MIYKTLSVSTRHISKETASFLARQGNLNASYRTSNDVMGEIHGGSHCYGWFVYCHDEYEESYPADLIAVFEYARSKGCDYINLDCDGEEHHELEEYDW